jgi:hypothetical protein
LRDAPRFNGGSGRLPTRLCSAGVKIGEARTAAVRSARS